MSFKLGPHETLIQKSEPWDFSSDGDAVAFEKSMIDFMLESHGIGLAANQIGIAKRVFVMGSENIDGFPKPFAVFNPIIIESSEDTILDKEGCLSYPGLFLNIKRPTWVVVEYQDSAGNINQIRIEGYLARCFLHEFDHLEGICFVDRVSQLKLQLAMKKLRKK